MNSPSLLGILQTAPPTSFDQLSHQQNLINYYNQTVAPDLAQTHFSNNGQRQSAISHLKNLRKNTDKWVIDPALRRQLLSLLDSATALLP